MQNAQSIAPSFPPVTSPQIYAHERQPSLPVGPTGLVHKGGVPWHKRLALTKAPSPAAHHVLLILGSFVSSSAEEAWPSKATLASMSGRSPRVVQRCLSELKAAGLISVRLSNGGSSHYRLTTATLDARVPPPLDARVSPPQTPASPKGTREVTSTREAAALLPVPVQEGVDEKPQAETSSSIEPLTQPAESNAQICVLPQPAETNRSIDPLPQPAEVTSIDVSSKPAEDRSIDPPSTQPAVDGSIDLSTKPTRHTCGCGHDWPVSFGPTCFKCQRKVGFAGGADAVPGKYDGLWEGEDDPLPDPSPLTPEVRAELEELAVGRDGYRKGPDGWRKSWL